MERDGGKRQVAPPIVARVRLERSRPAARGEARRGEARRGEASRRSAACADGVRRDAPRRAPTAYVAASLRLVARQRA